MYIYIYIFYVYKTEKDGKGIKVGIYPAATALDFTEIILKNSAGGLVSKPIKNSGCQARNNFLGRCHTGFIIGWTETKCFTPFLGFEKESCRHSLMSSRSLTLKAQTPLVSIWSLDVRNHSLASWALVRFSTSSTSWNQDSSTCHASWALLRPAKASQTQFPCSYWCLDRITPHL